jgi:hypothetical protein
LSAKGVDVSAVKFSFQEGQLFKLAFFNSLFSALKLDWVFWISFALSFSCLAEIPSSCFLRASMRHRF